MVKYGLPQNLVFLVLIHFVRRSRINFFSTNMLGNVYAENCGLSLDDGRIAFGTNYGLTVIDPRRVKHPESKTKVTFTDLRLNGISVSPDEPDSPLDMSLAYASEVNLQYYQSSFVVEFSYV